MEHSKPMTQHEHRWTWVRLDQHENGGLFKCECGETKEKGQ